MKTLENDEFRYLSESCTYRVPVYPYDYMNSCDRFNETELLPEDAFFSKLSASLCSDSEYTQATRVWTAFGCETMADYYDIYLQLDVLLLADCFEKFCKTCLEFYSLNPMHYYTTPGLAWDMQLLELIYSSLQMLTCIIL